MMAHRHVAASRAFWWEMAEGEPVRPSIQLIPAVRPPLTGFRAWQPQAQ